MKKSLLVILVTLFSLSAFAAETKKACVKDVKGKEVCKTIKVHKKLEGTALPTKK